jgi:hypothetical protein
MKRKDRPTCDLERVIAAFQSLETLGFFARINHTCCQSCGFAAVPEGYDDVVFCHEQDREAFRSGDIRPGQRLCLAWSGDLDAIVAVLESEGLIVEAPSDDTNRIAVRSANPVTH